MQPSCAALPAAKSISQHSIPPLPLIPPRRLLNRPSAARVCAATECAKAACAAWTGTELQRESAAAVSFEHLLDRAESEP